MSYTNSTLSLPEFPVQHLILEIIMVLSFGYVYYSFMLHLMLN